MFKLLSNCLLLLFTAALPLTSFSTETSPTKDISGLSNWPIILFVLFGMIGFIFALAWFVKRFGGLQFTGGGDMKIVSAIALGPKERVILVDIKGKQLLLGATSHSITRLHEFEEAVIPVDTNKASPQNDFLAKFQSLLNTRPSDQNLGDAEGKQRSFGAQTNES